MTNLFALDGVVAVVTGSSRGVAAVAPGYVDNVMAGFDVHADPRSDQRIKTFTPLGRVRPSTRSPPRTRSSRHPPPATPPDRSTPSTAI